MADRKTINKYYPPDWDPSKGSINTYVGQHPLRSRARKLNQGILVVRFELPYDIYCEGCKSHIGKGVRYNAEKKRIGNYYSTPIFSFTMKCHLCGSKIEIHTDPKNSEYVIVEGASKSAGSSSPVLTLDLSPAGVERSAIEQLEHENRDRLEAQRSADNIKFLIEDSERRWGNSYMRSKELRRIFRDQRKLIKHAEEDGRRLADKYSLSLIIDPLSQDDLGALQNMMAESREKASSSRVVPLGSIFGRQGSHMKDYMGIGKRTRKTKAIDALMGNLKIPVSNSNVRAKSNP